MIVNGRPEVKGKFDPKKELPRAGRPAVSRTARRRRRARATSCWSWGRRSSPSGCASRSGCCSPTRRCATRTSRCWRRACARYDLLRDRRRGARTCTPDLFSLEMWGGATFDTSMRFLQEDPWDRLDQLRAKRARTSCSRCCCAPATPSATRTTPTTSSASSSKAAAEHGIDVFRIFDSLNWIENMKVAMEAVREQHRRDLRSRHLLHRRHPRPEAHEVLASKYYVKMAKELVKMGTHILAHQGHGRAVQAVRGVRAGEGAAGRSRRADPLPHARHQRHQRRQHPAGGRRRRRHRRRGARVDERHDQPAEPQLDRRRAAATRRATRGSTSTRSTGSATTGKPSASSTTRSKRA